MADDSDNEESSIYPVQKKRSRDFTRNKTEISAPSNGAKIMADEHNQIEEKLKVAIRKYL